jgi:soluble lytic murein transglycosylase
MILMSLSSGAETVSDDRRAFMAALSDLQHGKKTEFRLITDHLHSYCLYPYLVYADLAVNLSNKKPQELQGFLNSYSETPLAIHLLKLWLYQLAENKDWKDYLNVYQSCNSNINLMSNINKDINLVCYQHEALWQMGARAEAITDLPAILNKNNNIPKACFSILGQALMSGNIAKQLLWQRIEVAFKENNTDLAVQLAAFLPDDQKNIFARFKATFQNPSLILNPALFNFDNTDAMREKILLLGVRKLALKDPRIAANAFSTIQQKVTFAPNTVSKVIAIISLILAQNHDPNAQTWLMAVPDTEVDQSIREWRVRTALWNQNWKLALSQINLMSLQDKKTTQWRYWSARAMEGLGQKSNADNIYQDLSLHGDYYGQLASTQLNRLPLSGLKEIKVNLSQIEAIARLPAIHRAHELYALHWLPESTQEWQWALSHMPEEDYLAAAELAIQWGWFERAISTVNLINDGGNINLKFPLAYHGEILNTSQKNSINPALMFAIIRQESLFTPYAHSHAGAIGLMQLMPETANFIASQVHLGFRLENLLDPNINLYLGGIYFKKLVAMFNGNEILAIAAYNAGPNRVKKWLMIKNMPADIWIENIPYHETRNYVKNILTAATFYEKELGLTSSLSLRMKTV